VARPALVVFDMAGTTVEDRGQVPAAFAAALAGHGLVVTAAQIDGVRGASKRQAIQELLGDTPGRHDDAARIYATFQASLAASYHAGGVSGIAGAEAVFAALRAVGIRTALTTGFDREITDLLLAKLGWDSGVVDAVVCGDDVRNGRPAPDLILGAMAITGIGDPAAVACVGDTVLDLEAGSRAGARWNIGVLSGAHGRAALERALHTHLIASVAELERCW
jgi:phosphonatase-like hydrolase